MESFSLATDIDLYLDLKVAVEPLVANGPPHGRIGLGDITVFDGSMHQPVTVSRQIGLCDDILISIDLSEKIYDQYKETALHVTSITVDGLEIKDHCHGLIRYDNDQNVRVQALYLGFNGRWSLHIPGPFYRWWHTVSGQGWLLSGARSISRDCAASLASTRHDLVHSDSGNTAAGNHPKKGR